MDGIGDVGTPLSGLGIICVLARIWRAAARSDLDHVFLLAAGDVAAGGKWSRGGNGSEARTGQRIVSWRVCVPVLCSVSAGNGHIQCGQSGSNCGIDLCAVGAGWVGRRGSARSMARFSDAGGNLGSCEVWPDALAVAVSGWAFGLCADGACRCECSAGFVLACAKSEGDRVLDRMGKPVGTLCNWEFRRFRMHCYSVGNFHAFRCVCAALEQMEHVCGAFAGNFNVHSVAGGIAFSRAVAKFPGAGIKERSSRLVDRVGAVWILSYHELGLSELAICDSGNDRGTILRMDVAENWVDLCICFGACGSGCHLALLFQDSLRRAASQENQSLR